MLFFGDSFIAGVGDPAGQGWVGRVVASSFAAGLPLVAYNLGVRRETSLEVAARWLGEARARMRAQASYGVVFAFGTNDATEEEGRLRVEPAHAIDALGRVLDDAGRLGLSVLVLGPAPAGEPAQDDRVGALSAAFAGVAARRGVPYVPVVDALRRSAAWVAEAAAGDGSHPGAGGYEELAQLALAGGWIDWLRGLPEVTGLTADPGAWEGR